MAHLIDKSALVAELKKRFDYRVNGLKAIHNNTFWDEDQSEDEFKAVLTSCAYNAVKNEVFELMCFLDTLEVKEMEEYKQPEYSCLKTVYWCGKKPHWNIGDVLAYYKFYSDIEGECVLGKVTKVEFDEEQSDWFYTFEDGSQCDEESLLEEQTYKKN